MDLTPARRTAIARRLLSLGIVTAPAGIIAPALSAQRCEGQEP